MTTQQQADQPTDIGERVAKVEGGLEELSNRVGAIQSSVDSLRTETQAGDAAQRAETQALRAEMQAGFAELRAEMNRFKNQVIFFILGSWVAGGATIGAAVIAAGVLT